MGQMLLSSNGKIRERSKHGLHPQKSIFILSQPHHTRDSPSFQKSQAKDRAHSRATSPSVSIWSRLSEQVSVPALGLRCHPDSPEWLCGSHMAPSGSWPQKLLSLRSHQGG